MGGVVKGVVGGLFGGGGGTGAMGTGRFRAKEYNIDKNAFDVNGLKSYGQEQGARQNQSNFIQQLQQQMQGQGPSLANMQLQQATNRNIAQTMGQAASQRGVNPALAARLALTNAAGQNQQAAMDSAIIRQQEMLNAQQQLGSQIGAQRQGDLAATDRDLGARMGKEQLGVQQQTGLNNTNQQAFEGAAQRRGNLMGGIGAALGGLFNEGGVVPAPGQITQDPEKVKAFIAAFQGKTKPKKNDDEPMNFSEGGVVPEKSKVKEFAKKLGQGLKDSGGEQQQQQSGQYKAGKGIGDALVGAFKGKAKPQGNDGAINPQVQMTANQGGEVPGRAVTQGDSPKNDFVLALLSPGEIVIPRTASDSKEKAKRFVDQLLDKKNKGGKVC
jgi:hypothetical protein